MPTVTWEEFEKIEARVGTILEAEPLAGAHKPAYRLVIDFGAIGNLTSSAQITVNYQPESLIGRQVVGIVNFPPKRIAGLSSQCLVTGFADDNGDVVLAVPDRPVPNGSRLF